MNSDQLKEIIDNHKLWLAGNSGTRADLRGADLTDADLRGASIATTGGVSVGFHKPDPDLLPRVAEAAMSTPESLDMGSWHVCETTHCLAGWAIHLSGDLGRALEALTSPSVAGSILMPSASHLFFGGNEEARQWCRAQLEPAAKSE